MLSDYYSKRYTASAKYIIQVLHQLRLSGIDEKKISEIFLSDNLDFDGHLPFLDLLNYFRLFSIIDPDPLLFIKSGLNISASDYGLLGIIASTSENLLQAMNVTYEYQDIVSNALHRDVIVSEHMLYNRIADKADSPEQISQYIELAFSSLITLCRILTGQSGSQLEIEIHFKHKAKAEIEIYESYLKTKVKFEQTHNQIIAPAKILNFAIKSFSPSIQKCLVNELPDQRLRIKQQFKHDVEQFIRTSLPYYMPTLNAAADFFNISTSTFKRRLKYEGVGFKQISDAIRFDMAKRLLRDEQTDILNVALMLGYTDRATFEKAFKRIYHLSPAQYKKSK